MTLMKSARRAEEHDCCRRGLSRVEVIIAATVVLLIAGIAIPAVLSNREGARASRCRWQLGQIGTALNAYHDVHSSFPPAAVWQPGPLSSLALDTTKRIDIITYDNWALLLLPHLDYIGLEEHRRRDLPIADPENARIRITGLPLFTCASDSFNRSDNHYRLEFDSGSEPVEFARGNYGFNGGTHNSRSDSGSTVAPQGDHPTVVIDQERGVFQYVGSGLGGINCAFSRDDLANGASTMIALEELRAGIHLLDPRGVWSFGQVGGSITWAHGINGDDFGPNNQWSRADDLQGCGRLHQLLGAEALTSARMPCVHYVDANQQATARSQHPGGVNVLFVDGGVRFISDAIDPSLWHVLHSRETPAEVLSEPLDRLLSRTNELQETPSRRREPTQKEPPAGIRNFLGMEFALVPAGSFEMGVPDYGFGSPSSDVTPHRVEISSPYYLGKYEVTQGQFAQIMHRNPSQRAHDNDADAFPVENVTWNEAHLFCQQLTDLPEERAAGRRYRLPTEAEWEYVCRSGSTQPHVLPKDRDTQSLTGEAAGAPQALAVGPVGRFPPNAFGFHDMRGNVWEWCSDWFDRDYYARSPSQDPQGPASGFLKVVRGSDWIFVGERCLINYPIMQPWKRSPFVGFRVVCEPTGVPAAGEE